MKLFSLAQDYTLELNREWIRLVPEFETIIRKDRGSEGDYRGDKKLYARRRLGFVYLMHDFASPIRKMAEDKKREEAMRMTGLEEKDIDGDVTEACLVYEQLQYENARALKSVDMLYKTLDHIDNYFANIDPEAEDKKGELKYDMGKVMDNIGKIQKTYAAIHAFEKMVEEQLSQDSGIRGASEKGDREGKARDWSYDGARGKAPTTGSSWAAASERIRKMEQKAGEIPGGITNPDTYQAEALGADIGEEEA